MADQNCQPGDVLRLGYSRSHYCHVDGVPVLTSQYGTVNGQYALRVAFDQPDFEFAE
ncbi:FliM/FliN family flagellar motor switch protein [Shigella flexneri]